ncbi:hypothetical protein [Novosphingobium sp. Gsoil 351]|uniref:hypothetical protein n=1 Tax=Novosphingobium sp. Gsoil 351 TaxID=2675225 RepID=UPI0012B4604C|nr:hypothetical protein [Novosphingobium sp. Gsoil 351]QGN54627.1 hypothetical protein GKE62_08725 [Novosphingobium sp. Gsoil 351]
MPPISHIVRERLEVEHLALVEALETVSPKLAAHYGKFDGLFARLCLLWLCIDNADAIHPPAEISLPTAERVAKFMETFIRPSAVAFYAGMLGGFGRPRGVNRLGRVDRCQGVGRGGRARCPALNTIAAAPDCR